MRKWICCLCLLLVVVTAPAQKLMRSISPRTMAQLFQAKDISPDAVRQLKKLYVMSHWKVLYEDLDPSDRSMALYVGKNMRLEMGDLVEEGSPHHGLMIHFSRTEGMRLSHLKVIFADEPEQQLFVQELLSLDFESDDDSIYRRQFTFPDGSNVSATVEIGWQNGLYIANVNLE